MTRSPLAAAALMATLAAVPAGAHMAPLYADGPPTGRGWLAAPRVAQDCPTSVDPARFATADALYADNAKMASFGRRATGSPNHRRFVRWIEKRLRTLPGAQVEAVSYPIDRWTERKVALRIGGRRVPLSGPVFYAKPTAAEGVTAPLVHVPAGTAIADADVAGKIVVRDAETTSVPNAAIAALEWWTYDPDLVLTKDVGGTYERENAGQQRIDDMQAAADRGAAGVIFVHGLPRAQVRNQYAPYEGVQWPVPSVMAGSDEGEVVKRAAAEGVRATLTLTARVQRVRTRMLIATIPGLSDEKIVVQSHTDGMNAVWDNGPVGMLAMADWFARLGKDCLPRTVQFVFTTGHLYQHLVAPDRDGSAEQTAKRLDDEYDQGKAAMVLPMEHMGARGWTPVPREDGGPGRVLVPSERNEPSSFFMGESPLLIAKTREVVERLDLRESIALRGIDVPAPAIPPNDNYGGEANPYQHHLIPSVSLVTAPWTLFDPAFGIGKLIDKELLRRQTLVFAELVHTFAPVPRDQLAGGYAGYRAARGLTCGTAFEALGLVRHCYDG
jgi:hypothetical protein